MSPRALAGRRIVVTRARDDADRWCDTIRARGGEPRVLPCVHASFRRDPPLRAEVEGALAAARWLVLTSARAVTAIAELGLCDAASRCQVAAIGSATASAARVRLGRTDLVGEGGAAELAVEVAARIHREGDPATDDAILHLRASGARPELGDGLAAAGLGHRAIDVYDIVAVDPSPLPFELAGDDTDAVLLASPSAATGFTNIARVSDDVCIACIGTTTAARARELGLEVGAVAAHPSLDALLEALP